MATKKPTTTKTLTTTRKRGSRTAVPPQASGVTEALIRERAYYLSLERNGGPADPVADWIRAERELTIEHATGA